MEAGNACKRRKTSVVCTTGVERGHINFADKIQGNLRLFEMPDSLVKESTGGKCSDFNLIGTPSEDAVLCSRTTTYSIKKAELSNQLYLLNEVNANTFEIFGNAGHLYELKATRGRVESMLQVLKGSEYPIRSDKSKNLLSRAQLREHVQASEAEIEAACRRMHIVEINGCMRMLDKPALHLLTRDLLDTILAHDLNLSALRELEDVRALMSVGETTLDDVLLHHVLASLGEPTVVDSVKSEGVVWKLHPLRVQQASAHLLFLEYCNDPCNHKKPWPMRDFFDAWEARTPTVAALSPMLPLTQLMEVLMGIAITAIPYNPAATNEASSSSCKALRGLDAPSSAGGGLIYVPADELSCDPAVRVQQLFTCRADRNSIMTEGRSAPAASMTAAVPAPGTFGARPKASTLLQQTAAAASAAGRAEFLLEELAPYLAEFVGGTGQPKTVVELLLPYTKLADGMYTRK